MPHCSCRVKGAVFMDLRVVHDSSSKYPSTAPSKEHFEKCMGDVSCSDRPMWMFTVIFLFSVY